MKLIKLHTFFVLVVVFVLGIVVSPQSAARAETSVNPDVPQNPRVVAKGPGFLDLAWDPPAKNTTEVIDYEVQYSKNLGRDWIKSLNTVTKDTSLRVDGLDPDGEYWLQVRSVGSNGSSAWADVTSSIQYRQIASSYLSSCALETSGSIKCRGYNVGDGSNGSERKYPVSVRGISSAIQISMGFSHSCALLSSGTIKCWGENGSGQLGDLTRVNRKVPVTVRGISGAKQVLVSGFGSTCALLQDGSVYCWGDNSIGLLGPKVTTEDSLRPMLATDERVIKLSGENSATICALTLQGRIFCWGRDEPLIMIPHSGGYLSDVTSATDLMLWEHGVCATFEASEQECMGSSLPSTQGDEIIQVAHERYSSRGSANEDYCYLFKSGAVKCKGRFVDGDLRSVQVFAGSSQISLNDKELCALSKAGSLSCVNIVDSLPAWTNGKPITLSNLSNVSHLNRGPAGVCALTAAKTIRCIGSKYTPNGISFKDVIIEGVSEAIQFDGSSTVGCAVLIGGTVTCWGKYAFESKYFKEPKQIPGVLDATEVSTDGFTGCAVLSSGKMNCWGRNYEGQLGNGSPPGADGIVTVSDISNAAHVSVRAKGVCVALTDGRVKCWGDNDIYVNHDKPVDVVGITNAVMVFAGNHSCALLEDRTISCWTRADKKVQHIDAITDAIDLDVTDYPRVACAVLANETVKCFEYLSSNSYSQPVEMFGINATGNLVIVNWDGYSKTICALDSDRSVNCNNSTVCDCLTMTVPVYPIPVTFSVAQAPTVPLNLELQSRSPDSALISWLPPASSDLPIDKYELQWSADGSTWEGKETTASSIEIGGLNLVKSYNFRSRAHSAAGWSQFSTSLTVHPPKVPSRVANLLLVRRTKDAATISWDKPDGDRLPIDNYRLQWSTDGEIWVSLETSSQSAVISNLNALDRYLVRVSAHSAAGWGEPSSIIRTDYVSKPVSDLKLLGLTKNSLNISWGMPKNVDGISITNFQIQVRERGNPNSPWRTKLEVSGSTLSAKIEMLLPGVSYSVRVIPVTLAGATSLNDYVEVSSGFDFSCAAMNDSAASVKCWGNNSSGQLGNGTSLNSSKAVQVSDLTYVDKIATGDSHACALTFDGQVYCWGDNESGQLGRGVVGGQSNVPVLVKGLLDVVDISTGYYFTCALERAGKTLCWGDNYENEIDSNLEQSVPTPHLIPIDDHFSQITAGRDHVCGLTYTQKVRCWGSNQFGQWGSNEVYPDRNNIPITWDTKFVYDKVMGKVKSIVAGNQFTCAINLNDETWCWGKGDFGELGGGETHFNGMMIYNDMPNYVSGSNNTMNVSAGQAHTCIIWKTRNGGCWGWNHRGQTGNPDESQSPFSPVVFTDIINVAGMVSISAGGAHTCASTLNDQVYCWGDNQFGQSGQTISPIPLSTPSVANVIMNYLTAIPGAVPDQVRSVVLISTKKRTAQWKIADANPNGFAITGYQRRTSTNGGKTWTSWVKVTHLQKTTGWVKGRTYLIQVRALNALGAGIPKQIKFIPKK